MLVLMTTTLFLNIPSKVAIAQQQQQQIGEEEMRMLLKKMMKNIIDEIKKENPLHADLIDKIPSMNLEETVKNLFAVEDIEQNLKIHAQELVDDTSTASNNNNQTTTQ
jgi:hypothetical protein